MPASSSKTLANDPALADVIEMPNNCPQLPLRAKSPNQSSPSAQLQLQHSSLLTLFQLSTHDSSDEPSIVLVLHAEECGI